MILNRIILQGNGALFKKKWTFLSFWFEIVVLQLELSKDSKQGSWHRFLHNLSQLPFERQELSWTKVGGIDNYPNITQHIVTFIIIFTLRVLRHLGTLNKIFLNVFFPWLKLAATLFFILVKTILELMSFTFLNILILFISY